MVKFASGDYAGGVLSAGNTLLTYACPPCGLVAPLAEYALDRGTKALFNWLFVPKDTSPAFVPRVQIPSSILDAE